MPKSKLVETLEEGRRKMIEDHRRAVEEAAEEYEKGLAELDRMIERAKAGPPVKNMHAMTLPESIQHVLMVDGPMHIDRLMEILKAGGVRMGDIAKPERFYSNVKGTISISKKRFRWKDKGKTIVQLREEPV